MARTLDQLITALDPEVVTKAKAKAEILLEKFGQSPDPIDNLEFVTMDVCSSCSALWSKGQFTENCIECGGFSMTRSCPMCGGKCGGIYHRKVSMSNAYKEAFYAGRCKLGITQITRKDSEK